MRRLLAFVLIVLTGCGTAVTTTTVVGGPTTSVSMTGPTSSSGTATTTTLADRPASGAIPARCVTPFADHLKMIEPLVIEFDKTTAKVGDLFRVDDAVGEKAYEALVANGSTAPYSCPEVGLEWNYFSARSPWEGIFEVARAHAPGTVSYLEALEEVAAVEEGVLADYDIATCEQAVDQIKQGVAEQLASDTERIAFMGFDDGLALWGLYEAYMEEVRSEKCPRDQLGNDEWGFMLEYYPGG